MSSKTQAWIKEAIPAFDLTQILQTVNFDHELKVTITSISDLSDYLTSIVGMPISGIETGDGDLINGSIVARAAGTSTWGSPGIIMADYYSSGFALMNTYYALLGIPTTPQYYIDYIAGNITALNYNDVAISAWLKLSALPALPPMFGSLPLSYFPFSYGDLLIMPKGIDFSQLATYGNELMAMYSPDSIEVFLEDYGATVEFNERDVQISWGSNEIMKYMIETYGEAPWSPYTQSSQADLGFYLSYDEQGVLLASVLYADIAATLNVDLTPYGGPNLIGESFTLSAEMKLGQPDAVYPSKNELYLPMPLLSNFAISMIGLSVIAGASVVAIIVSKRRK